MSNCPNCGAPITGDRCEYCGTVFRKEKQESKRIADDDLADALRSAFKRNDAIIDIWTSEIDNQLKKLHAILFALIPVAVFMIIGTIIWIICE